MITWSIAIAALIVSWCAVCAVSRMSRKTSLLIRLPYILLGAGALGAALQPFWLQVHYSLAEALLIMALAIFTFTDKRRRNGF